jgi:DNA-binding transcriptional regulator YhcF (GntR family)
VQYLYGGIAMSLRQTYAAWRVSDVTPLEKLVLLALADYASENGKNIYPKVASLATKTCLSERTVQRCLKELENKTYVQIIRGNGKSHSDYVLMLSSLYLSEYDAKRLKRQQSISGKQEDKIVENHFDQLGDTPF